MNDRIIIETTRAADIPVLTISREGARDQPVVFFIHGFNGNKDTGAELGLLLARAGFFFVALDGPMHGERTDPRREQTYDPRAEHVYPWDTGLDTFFLMLELVVQTGRDIDRLIDAFAADPRADTARVGVTGLSYGGMAAFYAAAFLPRVQAAVPMISHPSFTSRWLDVTAEAASYERWSVQMAAVQDITDRRAEWLRQHDPAAFLLSFAPRPLLIQVGDLDTDMPKSYAVQAVRGLQPAYAAHPGRLKLTVYDGVAHRLTREMLEENGAWFERNLK